MHGEVRPYATLADRYAHQGLAGRLGPARRAMARLRRRRPQCRADAGRQQAPSRPRPARIIVVSSCTCPHSKPAQVMPALPLWSRSPAINERVREGGVDHAVVFRSSRRLE